MRFLASIVGLVALSPIASVLADSDCRAARSAFSDIKALGPAATQFCASYLDIPETTTSYVTETPTSILTLTIPTTVVVTDSTCPKTFLKRDVAVPTGLAQYNTRILSSACSRLSIVPTASTTVTGIASTVSVVSTVSVPRATATLCTGCAADNQVCDIYHPERCCGGGCMCPRGETCHCVTF